MPMKLDTYVPMKLNTFMPMKLNAILHSVSVHTGQYIEVREYDHLAHRHLIPTSEYN